MRLPPGARKMPKITACPGFRHRCGLTINRNTTRQLIAKGFSQRQNAQFMPRKDRIALTLASGCSSSGGGGNHAPGQSGSGKGDNGRCNHRAEHDDLPTFATDRNGCLMQARSHSSPVRTSRPIPELTFGKPGQSERSQRVNPSVASDPDIRIRSCQ